MMQESCQPEKMYKKVKALGYILKQRKRDITVLNGIMKAQTKLQSWHSKGHAHQLSVGSWSTLTLYEVQLCGGWIVCKMT